VSPSATPSPTTCSRRRTRRWFVIDYQPSQTQAVRSIDHDILVDNIDSVARLAETF
jgi:hypothetical protein